MIAHQVDLDNAKSYSTEARAQRAISRLFDGLPQGHNPLRWVMARNTSDRYVPVIFVDTASHWLAGSIAHDGFQVIG